MILLLSFASRTPHFQGFIFQSGRLSFIISRFTPLSPFLRTVELPFIVITYNCPQRNDNNSVQLLTTPCVFSSIVQSHVIQGLRVARRHYHYQYYIQAFQEVIKILTGNTKYQTIDGYFCEFLQTYLSLQSRTNYQVILSGGWAFLLVRTLAQCMYSVLCS